MPITEYNFEHFILALWLFFLGYFLKDAQLGLLFVFGLLSWNVITALWGYMFDEEEDEEQ